MIKAPFNFVPLSDSVVFPDWASHISQDVPFIDGISGNIQITFTASTPLFVRNGHTRADRENTTDEYAMFSHVGDQFFLPGTSVKGMIRNVLEILTFGKMRVDPYAKFAYRDLRNKKLYTLIGNNQPEIRCGLLREKIGGGYEIIDCGVPYRIGQETLDRYLGHDIFKREFSEKNRAKLTDAQKCANYKYKLIEKYGKADVISELKFSLYGSKAERRVKVDPHGSINGRVVLTGQPNKWNLNRKDNKGKYYEFVFGNPSATAKSYYLSNDDFNQYKFIYAESEDWEYLTEKFITTKGMPVFFRLDESTGELKDWGLAYLYKLPYEHTVAEVLPKGHRESTPDFAECIFGYIDDRNNNRDVSKDTANKLEKALKGRVQFSPFKSDDAQLADKGVQLILNSPKASYYPIYINQESQGNNGKLYPGKSYLTYNRQRNEDKVGHPNGWKRYLHRDTPWNKKTDSDILDTIIHPILSGATFKGQVRFHNLKPEELGALLSALTFHGNQAACFHQIGMAKPYGYGKIKVAIDNITEYRYERECVTERKIDQIPYLALFEKYMSDKLKKPWIETPQVKELLTVTHFKTPNQSCFDYMTLDMEKRKNEFNDAKSDNLYLRKYSELINDSFVAPSIWNVWNKAQQERIEKERKEREEAERIKKDKEAKKAAKINAQREKEEREKAFADRVAKGLAFLLEKDEEGRYRIKEFKVARNRIDKYLKDANLNLVPEHQLPVLEEALFRMSKKPSHEEKKKGLWSRRDSSLWNYVEKISSKEFADEVFQMINK